MILVNPGEVPMSKPQEYNSEYFVGCFPPVTTKTVGPCPHGEYVCASCAGDQAKEVEHTTVNGVGAVGRLLKKHKK